MSPSEAGPSSKSRSVYLTLTLQALLCLGLVLFVLRRDWENVFLTGLVVAITLWPAVMSRYRNFVPPEFQFIAAVFVFLSLFLGSAADYYYKYWWWDIVLHTGSGFLLGIIGFLALFLLNRTDRIPRGMSVRFLCFFGVTFAVFLGVIWEIFEFAAGARRERRQDVSPGAAVACPVGDHPRRREPPNVNCRPMLPPCMNALPPWSRSLLVIGVVSIWSTARATLPAYSRL